MGICTGPVDAITGIIIGETEVWTGDVTAQGAIQLDKPDLFGGEKKEGGVKGEVYFLPGNYVQVMPSSLKALLPSPAPSYRGLCSIFMTKGNGEKGGFLWSSNSPYLRSVWARVRRVPNTFPAAAGEPSNYANMPDGQANPAHILYEVLTNVMWGMGGSPSRINVAAFQAAAKKLHSENFGMSIQWTRQSSIESFASEILDHIHATLFVNPLNGLIEIKLLRGDYEITELPALTVDNCKVTKFQRKVWAETVNEIVVTYTNPINEQEETVSFQDLANIAQQGAVISDSRNYYGIRNADLAMRVAARDLRIAASPLATMDIEANRSMWRVAPGDVLSITYPEYGLYESPVRVTTVDYGKAGTPMVRLSVVEDVFGLLGSDVFGTPTDEEPGSPAPIPFVYSDIFSLPAFFALRIDQNAAAYDNYPDVFVGAFAAKLSSANTTFEMFAEQVNTLGSMVYKNLGTKATIGHSTLTSDLVQEAGSALYYTDISDDIEPIISGFVMIGNPSDEKHEICVVYSKDGASVGVKRGCLDTTPKNWPAGSSVWFFDTTTAFMEETVFAAGTSPSFKLLPSAAGGTLPLDEAIALTPSLSDRPYLPSRPANVSVNGKAFGTLNLTAAADLTVSWVRRNRVLEDTVVLSWTDGDVVPESGQTTTVRLINVLTGVTVVAYTGITGLSQVISSSYIASGEGYEVEVVSVRDGLESLQGHRIGVFLQAGYGSKYGYAYGG